MYRSGLIGGCEMQTVTVDPIERSAIRKVSIRLVPFVALMFFINFLDRTAISFAGPNGMTKDLGLSAAQFGLAAGVFFIGYIVLEIPSNLALHKFGARRRLADRSARRVRTRGLACDVLRCRCAGHCDRHRVVVLSG